MRSREFITESAKLWGAKVRVSQANYVGYVDAQVWAANAQQARTILKQQYNIEDHHVGSVKEIKMKAKEFVKEAVQDRSNHSYTTAYHITGLENAEEIMYSGLDPRDGKAFLIVDEGDPKKTSRRVIHCVRLARCQS